MKRCPRFEREPEENSEMVSLCNDQNLDTQNHLRDLNQKVKKKTFIIMGKGQPLKLQPSMLSDSKWMRVLNSIVPNITMIPNGGNRSKLGIDILNKTARPWRLQMNEPRQDKSPTAEILSHEIVHRHQSKMKKNIKPVLYNSFNQLMYTYTTKTTQFYPI